MGVKDRKALKSGSVTGVWDKEEAIVPLGGCAIAHQWTKREPTLHKNKAHMPPHTKGGKKN